MTIGQPAVEILMIGQFGHRQLD